MNDIILGPIDKWSFSRLTNYEGCPYKVYQSSVLKLKGPERDKDNPAERGNRIHNVAEHYVDGTSTEFAPEMEGFRDDFERLREGFDNGTVQVEGDWGFDIDWQEAGWWDDNVWARIKLDAFEQLDGNTARVIDHKTGKKWGNEVKHTQQAQLYMVAGFMRYPDIEMIETEFWYLDQNKYMKKTYRRSKLGLYLRKFTERAMRMTTATEFPAKPSKMNCRWCDFGVENGTGECIYAVAND